MSITSGPPRKPPGQGTKPHKATTLSAVMSLPASVVPELAEAKEMLKVTKDSWAAFWSSPMHQVIVPGSDMPALTRMFHLADEMERCYRVFRKQRLVEGSQGQMVINPLGTYMLALAKEVRALEDRFGASVVSRLRLSIDLDAASRSLDAMNKRLSATDEEHADVHQDPRTRSIGATSS